MVRFEIFKPGNDSNNYNNTLYFSFNCVHF